MSIMGNPWEEISLEDYENHMCLDSVRQLQAMNLIMKIDLINEANLLPHAQLLIANLLIEYIGYEAFQNAVRIVDPEYVSCVIQINTDEKKWVSDSPYIHAFDRLDEVHHQMEEDSLSTSMMDLGYKGILQSEMPLPNGKALLRLDYKKEKTHV